MEDKTYIRILLAPKNCSKYFLETISYLSGMLIENPVFIRRLKNETKEEAVDELSSILEAFYKQKYNMYLADSK